MFTDSRSPATSLSSSLRACAWPFVASRLLILIAAFFLQYLLDSGRAIKYDYIGDAPLATLSATFDANWYNSIAEQGYSTSADVTRQQNYVFFPLLPFLANVAAKLWLLEGIEGGYAIAGVILSHLLFFVALALLHNLTLSTWRNETMAMCTTWLMAALPWSFVFSMNYTEALFLLLSLGAAIVACRTANRPSFLLALLAGLISALAALTRPQGVIVSLLVLMLVAVAPRGMSLARRAGYAVLATAPAAISVALFILYTGWRTGNVWAVLQNSRTWGTGWLTYLPRVLTLPPANPTWFIDVYATVGLITWVVLMVLLTVRFARLLRASREAPEPQLIVGRSIWPFVAYAWIYFLFTIANTPANSSWGRYLLVVFPCIWGLASLTATNTSRQFKRLMIGCLSLQVLFFAGAVLMQATP